MTIYKDFTAADIAKLRAGCEEWKYFPLEVGLDALKRIEALNLEIEELKKDWVQCHQQCGTSFHKAYCSFPQSGDRVCGCIGDGHEPECETFCSDHGTLKPCRHCLGNKGL